MSDINAHSDKQVSHPDKKLKRNVGIKWHHTSHDLRDISRTFHPNVAE